MTNLNQPARVNEVLMFPGKTQCKYFLYCEKQPECPFRHLHEKSSFERLKEHVMSAKRSVDVCVYNINEHTLSRQLQELRGKKVVRIICNYPKGYVESGTVTKWKWRMENFTDQKGKTKKSRVQVRLAKVADGGLMHHKFAVIDGRLLINGSFNWTLGAATINHENVMITDNMVLCKPYMEEFERLWEMYA